MKQQASKWVWVLILVADVLAAVHYRNWETDFLPLNGDGIGYYSYLPATFVYHDLTDLRQTTYHRLKPIALFRDDSTFTEERAMQYASGYVAPKTGRRYLSYNSGVALLETPFFVAAQWLFEEREQRLGRKLYWGEAATFWGNLFYVLLGLWLLRGTLRYHGLSEWATGLTLLSVGLGTNLYFFTVQNAWMSHSHQFFLYNVLMAATWRYYERHRFGHLLAMALSLGVIFNLRQTEFPALLIPILYGVYTRPDVVVRLQFWLTQWWRLAIAAVVAFIPVTVQLAYWKYITGDWVVNTYGEWLLFNWSSPEIVRGMFSFNNGWLAYTPVMSLSLIGMLLLRRQPRWLWMVLFYVPLHIYIVYSWAFWSYVNGFGSRPMIHAYPLLAISLALLLEQSLKKRWTAMVAITLVSFFVWLNMFQTHMMFGKSWRSEFGNAAFVLQTMGRTQLNEADMATFDTGEPQPSGAKLVKTLATNGFEDSLTASYVRWPVHEGNFAYTVKKENYSPELVVKGKDLQGGRWVRASLWGYTTMNDPASRDDHSCLVVDFQNNGQSAKWTCMHIENKLGEKNAIFGGRMNIWDSTAYFVKIPDNFDFQNGQVKLLVWDANGRGTLTIDNLTLELFN